MADTIDTKGQAPYESCGYCHEYEGNASMPGYPKLGGQSTDYLKKQLVDFQEGKREGEMQATAELLSSEDIEVVAGYFSQQKMTRGNPRAMTNEQRELASRLYFRGDKKRGISACTSCHGNQAQGLGVFPRLAGQHQQYLAEQLRAFRAGSRRNDWQGMMRQASEKLNDAEIESLSSYLEGLEVSSLPVQSMKNSN